MPCKQSIIDYRPSRHDTIGSILNQWIRMSRYVSHSQRKLGLHWFVTGSESSEWYKFFKNTKNPHSNEAKIGTRDTGDKGDRYLTGDRVEYVHGWPGMTQPKEQLQAKGVHFLPRASSVLDPFPLRPLPFIRSDISFRESPRTVLYLTRSKSFPYYLLAIALPLHHASSCRLVSPTRSSCLVSLASLSGLAIFFGAHPNSIHPVPHSFADARGTRPSAFSVLSRSLRCYHLFSWLKRECFR